MRVGTVDRGPTMIVSFGYRHGSPDRGPDALTIDVRNFRNPFGNPALRPLRGDADRVGEYIERGAGFRELYQELATTVRGHYGPVYLGCTGGHHRSVYLADRLGRELAIPVLHLNYHNR